MEQGVKALRESGATPADIAIRSDRYKRRYGEQIALNPMALAGNWTTLATEVTDSYAHTAHSAHSAYAARSQARSQARYSHGRSSAGGSGRTYTGQHLPDADEWDRYRQKLEAEGRYGGPLRSVRAVQ
jgi:hypothetical protein